MSGHPGSHSHPTPSRKEEKGLHVVCTAAVHRKRQKVNSADMTSKLLKSLNFPALQGIIANVKEVRTASGKMEA